MLGNMGPRKEWIWENIHSLCNKLNNEMQEKSLLTHRVGSKKSSPVGNRGEVLPHIIEITGFGLSSE